jgi:hypothetical protein
MDVAERLIGAFPPSLAGQAGPLADAMVLDGATLSPHSFQVIVRPHTIAVPERLYFEQDGLALARGGPAAVSAPVQYSTGDLASCLLTRHHIGYVRQHALNQVLLLREPWAVPFIVRLVGEYVIEIIEQIDEAFGGLSVEGLGAFVADNPAFIQLTRARVVSYWDCYYRTVPREDYVGFRLMDRIEATCAR